MLKEKIVYLPAGVLTVATVAAGVGLSMGQVSAVSESATATITVGAACNMVATVDAEHSATMANGAYRADIGTTTLKTICNDNNGYAIYAVGYTDDTAGKTTLESANGQAIATGLATSGSTSSWAMKVTAVAGTYAPTIENGFNSYKVVPATATKVASYANSTDASTGSSVQTSYAVYVAPAQGAGTYVGQVKYTLVNPTTAAAPSM